mgnify:CR=1 FL=1
MKNTIKFMIGLLAIGLVSCEPEFENAVTDEGFYDAGDADFSNYVSLGNSLTFVNSSKLLNPSLSVLWSIISKANS